MSKNAVAAVRLAAAGNASVFQFDLRIVDSGRRRYHDKDLG